MILRAKFDKEFKKFGIRYRKSYFKEIVAIEIYLFHFGFGVAFKKKVKIKFPENPDAKVLHR